VKTVIWKVLFDKQMVEPMPFLERVRTAMFILQSAMKSHSVKACCWYVDELLGCCGGWKTVEVPDPIFLIANTRTGSTELGNKLHEVGKHLISPAAAMQSAPYLWLWRLVRSCCPWSVERVQEMFASWMKRNYPGFHQRHKVNLFGPDTFEIGLNMTSMVMGVVGFAGGPNQAPYGIEPDYEEEDVQQFCNYLEAMLKKAIHFHGRPANRRPFVKGHFIYAAPQLHRKYPSALFVVTVRDMASVMQSTANFAHVLPLWTDMGRAGLNWTWIRQEEVPRNMDYCRREIDFFCRDPPTGRPPKRLVIQFEDYVRDLVGTMQKVFDAAGICVERKELEAAAASKVTTVKSRNETYVVNLSIEELGMPREWFELTFREWTQQMRSVKAAT